jgi:hypothetical protein
VHPHGQLQTLAASAFQAHTGKSAPVFTVGQ